VCLKACSQACNLVAGKGFLSAWLHQVCGAEDIILLDRLGNFAKKVSNGTLCCVLIHSWALLWQHCSAVQVYIVQAYIVGWRQAEETQ
jgi:hypothetical protein